MSDFSKNDRLGAMVKLQETAGKNDIIIGPLHDSRSAPLSIRVLSYKGSWESARAQIQSILKENKIFGPDNYLVFNDMPERTVHSGLITIAQYSPENSYHETEPMTVVRKTNVDLPILVIQTRFTTDIFKCLGQLSEPSA